jgi:hypothetical protein
MNLCTKALLLMMLAAIVSSCAHTFDGIPMYRLSRKKSLPAPVTSRITQSVDQHFGYKGEFWDGPYKKVEVIKLVRMTAENQLPFSGFADHAPSGDLFLCYSFVVMYGFTGHGDEKRSAYLPESIFYVTPDGTTAWFDLQQRQRDQSPPPAKT